MNVEPPQNPTPEELEELEKQKYTHVVSRRVGFALPDGTITQDMMQGIMHATREHVQHPHFSSTTPFVGARPTEDGKGIVVHRSDNQKIYVYHNRIECDPKLALDKNSVAHKMTFIPPGVDTIQLYDGNPPLYNQHVRELAALMGITVKGPDGNVLPKLEGTRDNNGRPDPIKNQAAPPAPVTPDVRALLEAKRDEHAEEMKKLLGGISDLKKAHERELTGAHSEIDGLKKTIAGLHQQLNAAQPQLAKVGPQNVQPRKSSAEILDIPPQITAPTETSTLPPSNGTLVRNADGTYRVSENFAAAKAQTNGGARASFQPMLNGTFVAGENGISQVFPSSRQISARASTAATGTKELTLASRTPFFAERTFVQGADGIKEVKGPTVPVAKTEVATRNKTVYTPENPIPPGMVVTRYGLKPDRGGEPTPNG